MGSWPKRAWSLRARKLSVILVAGTLLLGGCGPAEGVSRSDGSSPARGPKTITIGLAEEPTPLLLYNRPERAGGTARGV